MLDRDQNLSASYHQLCVEQNPLSAFTLIQVAIEIQLR